MADTQVWNSLDEILTTVAEQWPRYSPFALGEYWLNGVPLEVRRDDYGNNLILNSASRKMRSKRSEWKREDGANNRGQVLFYKRGSGPV